MATPSEKLAEALEFLGSLQKKGTVAVRSADLSRAHRELLVKGGFLQEVIKGWYIPVRPDETAGDSTAWYSSFWSFCAAYLRHRFQAVWCLSPEQSLLIHSGNQAVPRQLLIRTPKGGNKITPLPYGTSMLDVRAGMPEAKHVVEIDGLRLYSLPAALVGCQTGFYHRFPIEARTALAMVRDASDVLDPILAGGHSTVGGRLAGAFRNIGRERLADEILKTLRSAGYIPRVEDPFEYSGMGSLSHEISPYVNRLRLMWAAMRAPVLAHFPAAPGLPADPEKYLSRVEEMYVTDAYHSLSIEGYRVTPELIEKVRSGKWDPDDDMADRTQRDALAARGYWQAFRAVRDSLARVLQGANAGTVAGEDHRTWYREMFAPAVAAGLARPADLAGYRLEPVHIRRSMHVPPRPSAIRDMLPVFFDLLAGESEAAVRVVLGHFIFVFIHPYMDGNGRMARFLMNLMLASGGYSWTAIPTERRNDYMTALEAASVHQTIVPFTKFLAALVG